MRGIAAVLVTFVSASTLSACSPFLASATATERALCEVWGSGLLLPSRRDTQETAERLTAQIRDYRAACPGWPLPGGVK